MKLQNLENEDKYLKNKFFYNIIKQVILEIKRRTLNESNRN